MKSFKFNINSNNSYNIITKSTDVEQIPLDALVIRASAATDNHICSVSSEHNLHVYIARFAAVYCNRPVSVFVGGSFTRDVRRRGLMGLKPPEMLNILRVF